MKSAAGNDSRLVLDSTQTIATDLPEVIVPSSSKRCKIAPICMPMAYCSLALLVSKLPAHGHLAQILLTSLLCHQVSRTQALEVGSSTDRLLYSYLKRQLAHAAATPKACSARCSTPTVHTVVIESGLIICTVTSQLIARCLW